MVLSVDIQSLEGVSVRPGSSRHGGIQASLEHTVLSVSRVLVSVSVQSLGISTESTTLVLLTALLNPRQWYLATGTPLATHE